MSTPEDGRWPRLHEVFAAALERPGAERASFLDEACTGEAELRQEVESLLAHHREDGFLDTPGAEWAARWQAAGPGTTVGERLGRFEVLGSLGRGAMGEVYLAHDPTLERRVAIKLLSPDLAGDPGRIQRFRREAIALSALNHPNILTVHEVAEVGGRDLLVSELVEGVTLRERLRQGPLPVASALELTAQIANGLAAAHGLGIVHRDVKPENVMIRRDRLVKLLDFGLAKSLAPALEDPGRGPAWSTEAGLILGTVAYMSPEQARGEAAGPQADIWALGCVLFEVLTGRQAFPGRTPSDVLTAVLARDPELDELPAETPLQVRSLLRRCLQRDQDRRLHHVADARLELEEALREPVVAATATVAGRPRRGLRWTVGALVVAAALLGLAIALRPPASAPPPPVRFALAHPTAGRFFHSLEAPTLALSPDGSLLGFISQGPPGPPTEVWVRPLAELEARPVAGTEGARSLFWSPDGRHLGFVAGGKLRRVPVAGGTPVTLCDVETGSGVSATWGRDTILFATAQGDTIFRVPADGGAPSVAVEADATRGEYHLAWPWWLPDGRRFLYLAFHGEGSTSLRLAELGGRSRLVGPLASRVEVVDPDLLVFSREGALLAQRLDPDRAELLGPPRALVPEVRTFASTGWAGFATARVGSFVAATQNDLHRLFLVDGDGGTVAAVGGAASAVSMDVGPDGRRAIVDRLRPGRATYDLWLVDLERGLETRLTDDPGTEVHALWLPGGREIVYSATRGGSPNLLRRDLATGTDEELVPPGPFQIAVAVTPDGRRLLYQQRTEEGLELLSAPLDRSEPPIPVLRPGVSVLDAALSPDGRVLAYVSPEPGRPELFVRLLAGGESLRVSDAGASVTRFAADGETLFYTTFDRKLAAVRVTSGPALAVGVPELRFELPELGWRSFDTLPDGRLLALVRETDGTRSPLTVITGWQAPTDR